MNVHKYVHVDWCNEIINIHVQYLQVRAFVFLQYSVYNVNVCKQFLAQKLIASYKGVVHMYIHVVYVLYMYMYVRTCMYIIIHCTMYSTIYYFWISL